MEQEEQAKSPLRNRRAMFSVAFLILFCAFFFSPDPVSGLVRGVVGGGIESWVDGAVTRAEGGDVSSFDRFMAELAVRAGILSFKGRAPEAAEIVSHYCYGDGSELRLDSTYIRTSPIIRRALAEVPVGQSKFVSYSQEEDFRLSLALNPFTLSHRKIGDADWYRVSQAIDFDKPGSGKKVKTLLKFGLLEFKVRDAFVGLLNCKPFVASSEWQE
jgi:hypothetical protein